MALDASMAGRHTSSSSPLPATGAFTLETHEVKLLQACVGFHAKAQTDPGIRESLYQLWCKLEALNRVA